MAKLIKTQWHELCASLCPSLPFWSPHSSWRWWLHFMLKYENNVNKWCCKPPEAGAAQYIQNITVWSSEQQNRLQTLLHFSPIGHLVEVLCEACQVGAALLILLLGPDQNLGNLNLQEQFSIEQGHLFSYLFRLEVQQHGLPADTHTQTHTHARLSNCGGQFAKVSTKQKKLVTLCKYSMRATTCSGCCSAALCCTSLLSSLAKPWPL